MANSGKHGEWFATTPEFWAQIPLPIIGWKVWYADHVVACTEQSWSDAPRAGVQVLMIYHPEGRRTVVCGRDEYTLPGETVSKLGLEIEIETYHAILKSAMADVWRV